MKRRETGDAGEAFATELLRQKGYEILKNNYYTPCGEIDIIASSGPYIVFVEVRTRKEGGLVTPAESVTRTKRRKIVRSACHYLVRTKCLLQPRFDVVEVFTSVQDGSILRANHLENAFGPED